MTDKEKVLVKWPGAWSHSISKDESCGWIVYDGATFNNVLSTAIGSGTTESEAWANAAKGLE